MRFRFKKILKACFCILLIVGMPLSGMAADVDVYAEGAINGSRLKVYIYADVNIDNLLSYGVSLNYDAEELAVLGVTKDPDPAAYTSNDTKWHLGDSTAVYQKNPDPDYASPGEIIVIDGKVDPDNPDQGIPKGARALLAVVTFGPANLEMPSSPTLFLSYAKGDGSGKYKNFVRLNNDTAQVLDGADVYFGVVQIARQGDADGNGRITPRDIISIKENIGNTNAPCYTDCDGNGSITPGDIICVKSKI